MCDVVEVQEKRKKTCEELQEKLYLESAKPVGL